MDGVFNIYKFCATALMFCTVFFTPDAEIMYLFCFDNSVVRLYIASTIAIISQFDGTWWCVWVAIKQNCVISSKFVPPVSSEKQGPPTWEAPDQCSSYLPFFLHKCTLWAQFFSTWKRVNLFSTTQFFLHKYSLWYLWQIWALKVRALQNSPSPPHDRAFQSHGFWTHV